MHNEKAAKLDYWFGNGLTSLYFNIHARLMMEMMIMHVTRPLPTKGPFSATAPSSAPPPPGLSNV